MSYYAIFNENANIFCGPAHGLTLTHLLLRSAMRFNQNEQWFNQFYSGVVNYANAKTLPYHSLPMIDPISILCRTTIGPPGKRHSNGVSLVD